MEDIKEHASIKAYAQFKQAQLKLKEVETEMDDFESYGTTRDHAIAWAERQVDVWSYILELIEKDR